MRPPCIFPQCEKQQTGRGYCPGHYKQLMDGRELQPLQERQKNKGKVCTGPECSLPAYSYGLCDTHNNQRRAGRELLPVGTKRPVVRMYDGVACAFDGCELNAVSRGWCNSHAMQERRGRGMNPLGWRPPKAVKVCAHDDCGKQAERVGLCQAHYKQEQRGMPRRFVKHPVGRRVGTDGYVQVKRPGHPEAKKNSGWAHEHRVVMSDHLGRPLLKGEEVHHKNGDRADNRLSNLELWNTSQPAGQRIEDKVVWAKEILARYEPSALRVPPVI